jgi:hypothetical protein
LPPPRCCRPYLSPGAAERCLLLLSELLAACPPPPAAKQDQDQEQQQPNQQQQPLLEWLVIAVSYAAEELASYASLSAAALWQPSERSEASEPPAAERHAARRRQLSLFCVCSSLRLLLSHHLPDAEQPDAATGRLAGCCLEMLRSFVSAQGQPQQQQLERLSAAAAAEPNAPEWQQAAAQLLPLADCCRSLAQAVQTVRFHALMRHLLTDAAVAAAAALHAVLAVQAAAVASAAAASGSKAAARGGSGSGTPAGYCHCMCWKAIDSLQVLQQQLPPWLSQGQGQGLEEQHARALAAALNGLEQAGSVPGLAGDHRCLLLQLRCCRMLLPAALEQRNMREQALFQQHPKKHEVPPQGHSKASGRATLVSWLCSAAWQAYEGTAVATKRRRAGMTAAVVSTCLHPALFEGAKIRCVPCRAYCSLLVTSSRNSIIAAPKLIMYIFTNACFIACSPELHTPGGPLQQLLQRLLGLGAKSWRIMSILSLQLCGVLSCHAELAPQYAGSLQQLLLWGSAEDPGQTGVVRAPLTAACPMPCRARFCPIQLPVPTLTNYCNC